MNKKIYFYKNTTVTVVLRLHCGSLNKESLTITGTFKVAYT